MKKTISTLLLVSVATFICSAAPAVIQLSTKDASLWKDLNKDWPGTIKTANNVLTIVPQPSPTQKDDKKQPKKIAMAYYQNPIDVKPGDSLRLCFEIRFEKPDHMGMYTGANIDIGKTSLRFPFLRKVLPQIPVANTWIKYDQTIPLKDIKNMGVAYFRFNVYASTVEIKNVSIEILPAKQAVAKE